MSSYILIFFLVLSEGDNIAAIQRHGTSSSASCVLTINTVFPMIVVLVVQNIIKFVWTEPFVHNHTNVSFMIQVFN